MIRLDRGVTVLAVCTCGWRQLCSSAGPAWAAAAEHERACHPDSLQARNAAKVNRLRQM